MNRRGSLLRVGWQRRGSLHKEICKLQPTKPEPEEVNWLLGEVRKRGLHLSLREAVRQQRVERFKDAVATVLGWGLGLVLVYMALLGAIFAIDYWDGWEDRRREQLLLECLKDARNRTAAALCQVNWKPEND